jgi:hypothetical protein
MWIQRMIWILGRMLFWMLLLPLLVGSIYTLSNDKWWESLVFIFLSVLVLYKGLIRLTIQANSFVVRDDKVVNFFPMKTVRDRFDFASRGQTIVHLPHYGLLDRPYMIEIFAPDNRGGLNSCRLSLNLGHVMELTAWQRAYDNFVRYQEQLSLVVKRQLLKSSAHMALPSLTLREEEDVDKYLEPIVAELNLGLEGLGLKIEKATCKFTAGPTLVRLIAAEQEVVEKAVLPGEASQEDAELKLPAQ